MVVTWVTMDVTKIATVEYSQVGQSGFLDWAATGVTTNFTDGGSEKRSILIHRVTLRDLTPGATYREFDQCGHLSWMQVFL